LNEILVFVCLPPIWSMRGVNSPTAHWISCPGAPSRFRIFDLMFITAEILSSLSHVTGQISSCGTAWEASVKYEDAILSQKFIGEHSLCFVFAVWSSATVI